MILFLFQFAENKVGGSVNQKIKKVWPYQLCQSQQTLQLHHLAVKQF